jgi:hypothetical protein
MGKKSDKYLHGVWECIISKTTEFCKETHGSSFAIHGVYVKVIQDIEGEGSPGTGETCWKKAVPEKL